MTATEILTWSEGRLTWYGCGPTVYDSPHIGHARWVIWLIVRTYVSFDIIRRILQNYCGIKVTYCMNITDIDDKIIRRARQHHLLSQYEQTACSIEEVRKDIALASRLVTHCAVPLAEYLDEQYGHTVNTLFTSLPRKYEEEFFQKMDLLGVGHVSNVMRPDVVPRVTECVPQIVEYIQRIIAHGFAYGQGFIGRYVSAGSVYFDVPAFSLHHSYARLVPESVTDLKSLAEGEGSLATSGEKRSARDFALWKASKEGEPSWDSPWSKVVVRFSVEGRPGWHIECSVMATAVFGAQMDIHSGGHDLKFPHHDNEMAQAEVSFLFDGAYFNGGPWVRYFLHSGHLTINGCKMSKSLKNFITIDAALAETSPRRLRLLFLLHVWNQPFDYSPDALAEAATYDRQFSTGTHADASRRCNLRYSGSNMADSFNTRQCLNELKALISVANSVVQSTIGSPTGVGSVRMVGNYIISILKVCCSV
ncbi:LOW QUALITY PROTEIN: cysteine--tRNA ligase, cytoplasmic-like [Octopus sinensis]|uniref:LOW QUALITY PROTEIN: cysteine--tRNA ligase, cytoplasmic-like n=1 Tax=Octopus sinensis TaxID=2607531 RepID=A0A7E6EL50_9MOLL|nr:LOW QUALITY PROTEIN: cysteine--tRNA ligase, cytoplasmic-like [Octopus sinensis]